MATPFKVLAVDGGGIRGIIPALVLAEIERRTQRPTCELFDLVSGTSTGGIIALGLVKPGPDGKVQKSAADIVNIYVQTGSRIFPQTFLQGLHVGLVRGAKYDAAGLESVLKDQFGDTRLKEALTPALIPSHDIGKQMPMFFKSEKAKANPDADFAMRDVVRATTAAPTYFTPTQIQPGDASTTYALVDGGIDAGNPAMCAYAEAIKLGAAAGSILIVSLGTGEQGWSLDYAQASQWGAVEWAPNLIGMVMDGSNITVDYQLRQIVQTAVPPQMYYRFQVTLDGSTGGIDDASDANLKHLTDQTQAYLNQPDVQDSLSQLCAQLTPADPQPIAAAG
ncbi:MAG TPA: patatin-like phospholipase family protein [Chloroflexota bacterium]|nr:patatin-like phospholipase family protein [Chloroflexota bacterium]